MTDENTRAIPDMTDAECATAYRDLRKRANDAGFATVGEWIDEQPDTDGLAGEPRAWIFHGPENQKEVHSHHQIDVTDVPDGWSVEPLYTASELRTRNDRKAVLEEAAKVADEIARDFGNRWRNIDENSEPYAKGRIAGWSDGAADVAKSIRALAEGTGK